MVIGVTEKNIPVLKPRTLQCSRVRCHHVQSNSQMVWPRETENTNATNRQHQWSLREGLQKFIALCSQLSQSKIFQTETSGWKKNTHDCSWEWLVHPWDVPSSRYPLRATQVPGENSEKRWSQKSKMQGSGHSAIPFW